jgi:hypothetical protein
VWRTAQVILALVVIGLAVRHLARNWAEFRAQQVQVVVQPLWLLLALLTVVVAFVMLIEAWRRLVVSQGERLEPLPAARIWLVANLGKYLPGKVWSIAGAAVLAERAGVGRAAAVTAALVLQALAFGSGVMVVALTAPRGFSAGGPVLAAGAAFLGVAALAGVVLLCTPPAVAWVQRRLPASWPALRPVAPHLALAGFGVNALAWIAYGASLVMLAKGLMPQAVPTWTLATAVFTAGYLVGLVAVFAPAGFGPRESMFILLLSGPLGPKAAVGLAAASRILLTLVDLLLALPFLVRRRAATTTPPQGPRL